MEFWRGFRSPAILEQDSQPPGLEGLCSFLCCSLYIYSCKNVFKASPKIQTTTAQDGNEAILTRLSAVESVNVASIHLFFSSFHRKVGVVFCEMRVCVLFLISRKGVRVTTYSDLSENREKSMERFFGKKFLTYSWMRF